MAAHAIDSILENLDTKEERKAVLWMFQLNHYGMRQFVVPKMNPYCDGSPAAYSM